MGGVAGASISAFDASTELTDDFCSGTCSACRLQAARKISGIKKNEAGKRQPVCAQLNACLRPGRPIGVKERETFHQRQRLQDGFKTETLHHSLECGWFGFGPCKPKPWYLSPSRRMPNIVLNIFCTMTGIEFLRTDIVLQNP